MTKHVVAIHQPQYWPWPPYLHKLLSVDTFVYLDTVQFSKNDVQNRNRIASHAGPQWLTLPVAHRLGQTIAETRIADRKALGKHLRAILTNYAKTPGLQRWRPELEALYARETDSLCETAIASTEWMLGKLGALPRRVKASELSAAGGSGSALVASICRELEATDYCTGRGALDYLRHEDFQGIACAVHVQTWRAFEYPQVAGPGRYVPDLSTLDLILNRPDDAADLLRQAGGWEPLWPAGAGG